MKKLLILFLMLALILPAVSMAAGTVVVSMERVDANTRRITFTCTGDAANGTIPATSTDSCTTAAGTAQDISAFLEGFYLYRMWNINLVADVACTATSDVYLKSNDGDGSADHLSGDGVDQLDTDTTNYKRLSNYDLITGPVTYSVANQAAVGAQWSTVFELVK